MRGPLAIGLLSIFALASLAVAIPVPSILNSSANPNGWVGSPCSSSGSCPFSSCTICGNYCGPGWCEQTCESESVCQFSVAPQENSCTDTCCMKHDNCCGYNDSRDCNKNLVTCLDDCPWAADCKGPDGWWHSATIQLTFASLCVLQSAPWRALTETFAVVTCAQIRSGLLLRIPVQQVLTATSLTTQTAPSLVFFPSPPVCSDLIHNNGTTPSKVSSTQSVLAREAFFYDACECRKFKN
jgi:hypothetical protein